MHWRAFPGCLAVRLGPDRPRQGPQRSAEQLQEPLFRVGRAKLEPQDLRQPHPLDAALDLAREALERVRRDVRDYTATVVKREMIKDQVGDYEYMFTKIRSQRVENGKVVSPRCVYFYFLKPDSCKGREVIWIEGQNSNKLVAHEGGAKGKFLPTVWLKPDSTLAMLNQRLPDQRNRH